MLANVKAAIDAQENGGELDRFEVMFDNTHSWKVEFPSESFLSEYDNDVTSAYVRHSLNIFNDLEKYKSLYKGRARVVMEINFPDDYPDHPPFVRVIRPRFKQHSGHVTIGGSICTEILTPSAWRNIAPNQLILILHNLLIDGGARVDFESPFVTNDYTFYEAEEAFKRVARDHGWLGVDNRKRKMR